MVFASHVLTTMIPILTSVILDDKMTTEMKWVISLPVASFASAVSGHLGHGSLGIRRQWEAAISGG